MRFARALFASLLVAGGILSLRGQVSPDRSLAALKAAEGLEVTLFAAEPDLINPTSIDVDARGRVWVTEAANYRLFKNPPGRREGDRIRVLEDTDGDGRCDRATTFYQSPQLQAPLGIAVLGPRVYVCQSPDLFYLEDTDGDGVADRRTVVLTGFKGIDHDHAIHGVQFGPDGRLYMSNGDQGLDVTDKEGNRVHVGPDAPHLAASVLRTDLEGRRLELLAEGLRNPFEPAVDSFGNVFISDNDDDGNEQCRIVYVLEGGNYGYWPKRRGNRRLDAVHWNEDLPGIVPKILKTGFGSPTGMIFYEGSLLPEPYRRTLIHADAGPGVIRSYPLAPRGAAYATEIRTLLSCPTDKWFRPIDVAAAPDGSLFVADWYDPGVGGHNIRDFTRGRIYRLAPPGSRYKTPVTDLSTPTGAAAALRSPNNATRFLGHQTLSGDSSAGAETALLALFRGNNATARARALWLLAPRGEAGRAAVLEAASDRNPELRAQAVRIGAAEGSESLRRLEALVEDPDPGVRRELLLRLQHVKEDWASDWILRLARKFDGEDRFYREALGIAMRGGEARYFAAFAAGRTEWDRPLAELAFELHTPEAAQAAERILADAERPVPQRLGALRVIAAAGGADAAKALVRQLDARAPRPLISAAVENLTRDEGRAWPALRREPALETFVEAALARADLRDQGEKLIRELRLVEFLPKLAEAARDAARPREARIGSVEAIAQLQTPGALAPLRGLLADADGAVAAAAARALAAMGNDDALRALQSLLEDRARPKALRAETVRLLGGSRSGALMLLHLAEQDKLAPDLVLEASTVTNASPHENIRLMAAKLLPLPTTRTGKPLPSLAILARMRGESVRGRAVFFGTEGPQCARCHRVGGEGRDVGPDLSKIGAKLAREALLESILNPSAAIAHEYQVWLVRTRTRGFLDGYIRAETADAVELVDSNGNTVRIPTAEVVSRTRSSASLMPTGLSSGMTTQQLVDVVEFLATLK